MFNDLAFNQDFTCILISTGEGHKIFNCDPFGEFYSLVKNECPTAIQRMLFSTLLTIVVPETGQKGGNKMLKIFNLKQNLKICDLTFPSGIIDLMLNRKRLVVFLELGQIYIYNLSNITLSKVLEVNIPQGEDGPEVVADLSADDKSYLVLPLLMVNDHTDLFNLSSSLAVDPKKGSKQIRSLIEFTRKNKQTSLMKKDAVLLEDLRKESHGWILVYDTIELKPRLLYEAHDSSIAKVAISKEANKIASASSKGTIIRISHLEEQDEKLSITRITSLRRGHHPAHVNCLKFNLDSTILGCGSESNTIHLFHTKALCELAGEDDNENADSEEEYEGSRHSSLEDLNENLANLLILKQPQDGSTEGKSYFSMVKEKSGRLLDSQFTQLLIKKLPYRDYFDNLILEPPRRCFAYTRLPEVGLPALRKKNNVEIGFTSSDALMLASYQTGTFYMFKVPKVKEDEKAECTLLSSHSLID